MEIIIGMVTAVGALILEIGIVNGLFVLLFVAGLRVIIKYMPALFREYFKQAKENREALDKQVKGNREALIKAHEMFSANLSTVTDKFIGGLDRISDEHDKQFEKLIDIHRDIKDLK